MNVNEIRELYPAGTQIILEEMSGESQMPYGLKGTVDFVDDIGQIHMNWENGSSLLSFFGQTNGRTSNKQSLKTAN